MSVVATLLVRVAANLTELDKSFSEMERAAVRLGKSYTKLGGELQGLGSKLTTGLTAPIAGFAAVATKSFIDFEGAMNGVQAALQPTTAEMKQLEDAAMEWGSKTVFSATEAAQGLGELGKAGVSTTDSIKLLPSVLSLATVGEMELAEAAALTTNTLAQFRLEAADAEKVNDVLAAAAQASTTSVKELGSALVYAGPLAGAFGLSIEETAGALAQFAQTGIKGEKAGVVLKNVLGEIKNPAKGMRDVLGELGITTLAGADGMIHMTDVITKLGKAGATDAQILRAFGEVAGGPMVSMVKLGADSLAGMTEKMEKSGGTAKRVSETLLQGLGGAIEGMKGSMETAGIAIGKVLAPALEKAANLIGRLAEWVSGTLVPAFQSMPEWLQVTTGALLALAAAIGPLIWLAGTMASAYGALVLLFAKSIPPAVGAAAANTTVAASLTLESAAAWVATTATAAFEAVMSVLMAPLTLVIGGIALLVIGLRYLTGSWEGVLKVLTLGILNFQRLGAIWEGIKSVAAKLGEIIGVIANYFGTLVTVIGQKLTPIFTTLQGLWSSMAATISGVVIQAWQSLTTALQSTAESGFGQLVRYVVDLAIAMAKTAAIDAFIGAIKLVEVYVKSVIWQITTLASIITGAAAFAWQGLKTNIDGAYTSAKTISAWFGVDLPKAIDQATGGLLNAGSAFIKWARIAIIAATAVGQISGILPQAGAASRDFEAALAAAAGKSGELGTQLNYATGAVFTLKGALPPVANALDAATGFIGDFGKSLGTLVASGAADAHARVKDLPPVINAAGDAAKEAAKKLKEMGNALAGEDAIANLKTYTDALADLTKRGLKVSSKGAKDVSDALDEAAEVFRSTGRTVPAWMGKLWASLQPPIELPRQIAGIGDLFGRSISTMIPSVAQLAGAPTAAAFKGLGTVAGENLGKGLEQYLRGRAVEAMIGDWTKELGRSVNAGFASMLTGQTGFRDGLRSMFGEVQTFASSALRELQAGIGRELQDVFSGGTFDFKDIFGSGVSKGKAAVTAAAVGIAVGTTMGTAFGQSFGMAAGVAMGAATGAISGAMTGMMFGPQAAAIGAIAGGVMGAISGFTSAAGEANKQKAMMQDVRDQLLNQYGSMKKIAEMTQRLGVDMDALFYTKDVKAFEHEVKMLNYELAHEARLLKELATGLDETSAKGALLSKDLFEQMGKRRQTPGHDEAIFAFMGQQQTAAAAGLDAFLTNATIRTEKGAAAISASLAGVYQSMVEGGMAPTAAFAALEPTIAKLQQRLTEAGFAGAAAFTPLADLARLSADAIAGPVFDAMAGLEQGLTATFNLGLLNKETFAGFAAEIYESYHALELQGKGGEVAMAGMRGALQKTWELSEEFGYALNENEQTLIDSALAAGVIGDKFRPAADRMVTAIDALVERMDLFLKSLESAGPAATDASRTVSNELAKIKAPTIYIPTQLEPPEFPDGGMRWPIQTANGSASATMSVPALAAGGIVRRPTLAMIGERGPEAVIPLDQSHFDAQQDLTVYLDSEVITRAVLRKQPRQLRAYGAVR